MVLPELSLPALCFFRREIGGVIGDVVNPFGAFRLHPGDGPFGERLEDAVQRLAFGGSARTRRGGHGADDGAGDDAFFFQCPQALAQGSQVQPKRVRDFVEPLFAAKQGADNVQGPALAQKVQGIADGAEYL